MDQGSPVSLENASGCALTAQFTFAPQAKAGLRLYVRSIHDGLAYDSEDLYLFDLEASPGQRVQKTMELSSRVRFFRVIVENRDDSNDVADLQLTATVADRAVTPVVTWGLSIMMSHTRKRVSCGGPTTPASVASRSTWRPTREGASCEGSPGPRTLSSSLSLRATWTPWAWDMQRSARSTPASS